MLYQVDASFLPGVVLPPQIDVFASLEIFSKVCILIAETFVEPAGCIIRFCCNAHPKVGTAALGSKPLSGTDDLVADPLRTEFSEHK